MEVSMKVVTIALVGAGGYGEVYLNYFKSGLISPEEARLVGIVDPAVQNSKSYDWIKSSGIPIYDDLDSFYKERDARLIIIASPTGFHKQQCLTALSHESDVLCEKPLVPTVQEIQDLDIAVKSSKSDLGVGFQWSFSNTMRSLKKDILSGKLGRPLRMKTMISWPRPEKYYKLSTWKGKILGDSGKPILDSILANATAHYLHNIFFLLGESMNTSACPEMISAELYRAKHIQSFDTCFLKGELNGGCEFLYIASHAVSENHSPSFVYEFENAVITFNTDTEDNLVKAVFKNGDKITYGNPYTPQEEASKVRVMIEHVRDRKVLIPCSYETVRPHLLVSNALFDFAAIWDFPEDIISEKNVPQVGTGRYIDTLYKEMLECFLNFNLPSAEGYSWSKSPSTISLKNYTGFTGKNHI